MNSHPKKNLIQTIIRLFLVLALLISINACSNESPSNFKPSSYDVSNNKTINNKENSIPPSEESLTIGSEIYNKYCKICHGEEGSGNGPAALALKAPLKKIGMSKIPLGDQEIMKIISHGRGEMKGWINILSEEEIWHTVNYIRFLGPLRE